MKIDNEKKSLYISYKKKEILKRDALTKLVLDIFNGSKVMALEIKADLQKVSFFSQKTAS